MIFLNIAFEAELNRYEDSEFEDVARRHCNEHPDTRNKVIEELRSMVYERGECNPRRIDDAYCLRFLRCRRFVPALAYRLMVRYEDFRRKNAHLYNCDPFELKKVKHVYAGTLPESPEHGRLILMRFGRWDTNAVSIDDVVRCALVLEEIAVQQPKLQILGVTVIIDLEGLSFRHISQLTPAIANQIVSLMGVAFPLPLNSIHLVNYNWILNTFWYVFKQFIPKPIWNTIHFHGYDLSSLQKQIHPRHLPAAYGGYCRHVISTEEWLGKIYEYRDEYLVQELKDLGFTIKD
ncbi:clavesin-2-like [Galleria mellonella]|uniref:Clavesin-2-like n=1 Tax=Galleria mellonella TaxID=7137 RepID=A0ABM3MLK2_GALME|nr:clavesin-2-like [Galleria mellonella]